MQSLLFILTLSSICVNFAYSCVSNCSILRRGNQSLRRQPFWRNPFGRRSTYKDLISWPSAAALIIWQWVSFAGWISKLTGYPFSSAGFFDRPTKLDWIIFEMQALRERTSNEKWCKVGQEPRSQSSGLYKVIAYSLASKQAYSIKMTGRNWKMKWDERWINSMKWSWFKVPVKVEQINEYLFSDTVTMSEANTMSKYTHLVLAYEEVACLLALLHSCITWKLLYDQFGRSLYVRALTRNINESWRSSTVCQDCSS